MGAKLLSTKELDGNPCSVAAGNGGRFAVGTYTLNEACASRSGRLYFFQVSDEGVSETDALDFAGIFDVRWGAEVAACACSDGRVVLCCPPHGALAASVAGGVACSTSMCTSVDWTGSGRLVACGQDGCAHVIAVQEGGATVLSSWQAHSLEAWVVRTSAGSADCVFSGADDACFKW